MQNDHKVRKLAEIRDAQCGHCEPPIIVVETPGRIVFTDPFVVSEEDKENFKERSIFCASCGQELSDL